MSNVLYRAEPEVLGITGECIRRCRLTHDCKSFVLDYRRQECSRMQDPASDDPVDFRIAIGKSYFGGVCVPSHLACSKMTMFERVINYELRMAPRAIVKQISLQDCQRTCVEERGFVCRSANYFYLKKECHLLVEDRTAPHSQLVLTGRAHYIENQCQVDTSTCSYRPKEKDMSVLYITKSVSRAPSPTNCDEECNLERDFNCRSYTVIENTNGDSVCLLSSDTKQHTPTSVHYKHNALYFEKDCQVHSRQVSSSTAQMSSAASSRTTETITRQTLRTLPPICIPDQFTYEKVMGFDLRFAYRERIPTRSPIGIVDQCHTECQRMGDRCNGFIIQYATFQSCFQVDTVLGESRNAYLPSPDVAFFEKICLRENTCGKRWTFERIMGHEIQGTPTREVEEVSNRMECEDICLREVPPCRSATYDYNRKLCRLFSKTRRSNQAGFFRSENNVDYLENQCSVEPSGCQYRDFPDRLIPFIDRITRAFSLQDCQRQCDSERQFTCRSVSFETVTRDCVLSSEDSTTIPRNQEGLQFRRNSVYSEKGTCEQVSVQCNEQDMLMTINFGSPFHGRVYAKGNPSQCSIVGTGQTTLQFAVSLGTRCGTKQESTDRYVNEVIVQQHPVIMTDIDKTIRVVCSFEAGERTYTLAAPIVGSGNGMEVGAGHQMQVTSLVTNTAPPPNVAMRVLDLSGRDARAVGLGDELMLRIELQEPTSAFAIFARNLYARSSGGESLFLIDSSGCPVDQTIFPALQLDSRDRKSLISNFKAFRFPSSGLVNFEVQIRFCQDKCEPVRCDNQRNAYGRRRRGALSVVNNTSITMKDVPANNSERSLNKTDTDFYPPTDQKSVNKKLVNDNNFNITESLAPPSAKHFLSSKKEQSKDPLESLLSEVSSFIGLKSNSSRDISSKDPNYRSKIQESLPLPEARVGEPFQSGFGSMGRHASHVPFSPYPLRPAETPGTANKPNYAPYYPSPIRPPKYFSRPVEITDVDDSWIERTKLSTGDSQIPKPIQKEPNKLLPTFGNQDHHRPHRGPADFVPNHRTPQNNMPSQTPLEISPSQSSNDSTIYRPIVINGPPPNLRHFPYNKRPNHHQSFAQSQNRHHDIYSRFYNTAADHRPNARFSPAPAHQVPVEIKNSSETDISSQRHRHNPLNYYPPNLFYNSPGRDMGIHNRWQFRYPSSTSSTPHQQQQTSRRFNNHINRWEDRHKYSDNARMPPYQHFSKPKEEEEIVAVPENTVPKEVPLSFAIMVGEDSNGPSTWNNEPFNRVRVTSEAPGPPQEIVCTPQSTVIVTSVTLTLIYLALGVGAFFGYRWYRKNRRKTQMQTVMPLPSPTNNENVTYGSRDVMFRNVYGNYGLPT